MDERFGIYMNLSNKVALVTGASSGIGKATVKALTKAGINVIATARRKSKLTKLSKEISSNQLFVVSADLCDESDIKRVFKKLDEKWARLDFLVNSAGVGVSSTIITGLSSDWRKMLETNVMALAIVTQKAIKRFPDDGGTIVNIGSTSGHRVASTNSSMYAATKFAVRGLTEGIRKELRAINNLTRVCLVSPGRVRSAFFQNTDSPPNEYPQLTAKDVATIILQIIQAPPEVEINDIIVRPKGQIL